MIIQKANDSKAANWINLVFFAVVSVVYVSFAFILGFDLSTIMANRLLSYLVSYAALGILFWMTLTHIFPEELRLHYSRLLHELAGRNLIELKRREHDDLADQ